MLGAAPLWIQAGARALPPTLLIAGSCIGSFCVIALLLRYQPKTLLRWQLALRVLDAALVFMTPFVASQTPAAARYLLTIGVLRPCRPLPGR